MFDQKRFCAVNGMKAFGLHGPWQQNRSGQIYDHNTFFASNQDDEDEKTTKNHDKIDSNKKKFPQTKFCGKITMMKIWLRKK